MDHKLQMTLVIVIFLSLTVVAGLLVAQTAGFTLGNLLRPSLTPTITGAAVATCTGANCPVPLAVCAEKIGRACRIACSEQEDCDDRISATTDLCKNPGTEFSLCVNREFSAENSLAEERGDK
ncbi:MAG: hypothetical protein AABX13_06230 [Nanoarchaeota archaeon]